jgi:energy-coupling factor transport system permease protein
MDPRAKMLCILSAGFTVISLDVPEHLLLFAIMPLVGHALARFRPGKYVLTACVLLMGLWSIALSQALFYHEWPRTAAFTLVPEAFPLLGRLTGGVYIYKEGFVHGVVQGLRFATMTAFGLLMTWTTEPRDILLGLTTLRMPYGLAFMFITSVRFLPILVSEIFTVVTVQRLRGANPTPIGPKAIRRAIGVLTPVLANCVRRASTLGASCESRAFNPTGRRTHLVEMHWKASDMAVSCIAVATAVALLFAKIVFWLYRSEVLYVSDLRWLYQIAREL